MRATEQGQRFSDDEMRRLAGMVADAVAARLIAESGGTIVRMLKRQSGPMPPYLLVWGKHPPVTVPQRVWRILDLMWDHRSENDCCVQWRHACDVACNHSAGSISDKSMSNEVRNANRWLALVGYGNDIGRRGDFLTWLGSEHPKSHETRG